MSFDKYSWKINAIKAGKRAGATLMAGGGAVAALTSAGQTDMSTMEGMVINAVVTLAVFAWNIISNRLKKNKNTLI